MLSWMISNASAFEHSDDALSSSPETEPVGESGLSVAVIIGLSLFILILS